MSSLKKIQGQPSWTLATPEVEAALTRQGGHLGPVRFRIAKDRWVEPFDIAPWVGEKLAPETPEILRVMRGDFFCLPFGGNTKPYRGEQHPPHGESCNEAWTLESSQPNQVVCSMETHVRKGRVEKTIKLIPGHSAVYLRHVISGMKGPMSLGHHPILKLPGANAGRISTSRFTYGQVSPIPFEDPVQGGYSILKTGATFTSLRRVPRADGQNADLSVYPSREGYEDLALIAADPTLPFAWTALVVAEKGYVWFSLKNPRVLRSTIFWMSNGGRHYAPWNGRHRHAIGLEEVTAYFDHGLAASAQRNALNRAGVETCVQLDPKKPLTVSYIMAVAAIPLGFDIVKSITAAADGRSVTLTSQSGKTLRAVLDVGFVTACS